MTALANAWCQLEPLQSGHAAELAPAAHDAQIWRYMPTPMPVGEEGMRTWIADRLRRDHPARGHVFLVRDGAGNAAGSTSLYHHDALQRRAEVGYTWYGTPWHGTGLNKAVKRLLLEWAFDRLGLRRVQLKCDGRNEASRRAIEALGAVYEGTLRQHDEVWDGHMRDAAVFSILESEWPDVRDALDARLDALNKR